MLDLKKTYISPFSTSRRNKLLYWLANLAVFPAFMLSLYFATVPLLLLTPTWIMWATYLSILFASLGILSVDIHWHMAYSQRYRLYLASIVVIFLLLMTDFSEETVQYWLNIFVTQSGQASFVTSTPALEQTFLLFTGLFLIVAIWCSVLALRALAWTKRGLWGGTCLLGIVAIGYIIWNPPLSSLQQSYHNILDQGFRQGVFLLTACLLYGLIHALFIQSMHRQAESTNQETNWLAWGALLLWGIVAFIISDDHLRALTDVTTRMISTQFEIARINLVAIDCVGILILAAGTENLYYRQWASIRRLLSPLRHDRISKLVSSTLGANNLFNRIEMQLTQMVSPNSTTALLNVAIVIAIGAIIWHVYSLYSSSGIDELWSITLFALMITLATLLSYALFWFLINRQKHIVVPFEVLPANDPQLQSAAGLVTHIFVQQLRSIAVLLNLRQVENTNHYSDRLQALFVTSGQEQAFVQQLESLSDFEATGRFRFSLGSLLRILIKTLATTKVEGKVQRRQDGSLEVWIELERRSGHRVAVDKMIIPATSLDEVAEYRLQELVRESAIKLVMQLGQDRHLASSWQSLRHFLDGLEASYQRNWWQAIAHYRRAIQFEESTQGEFGIGHYHLGAAFIFLGDVRAGFHHLQLADAIGPPLPETKYMLSLALLNIHWSTLDQYPAIFHSIIAYGHSALRLRTHFPEVSHLIGAAYYQYGKTLRRSLTSISSTGRKKQPLYRRQETADAMQCYRQAERHFRRAIRQYQHALRRLPRDVYVRGAVQTHYGRILRSLMIATHQLADSQRSLKRRSTADGYYRDVAIVLPGNIRNLTDQAMNLCQVNSWQRADEHLRRTVLSREEGKWNDNAHYYMGWTLVGGILDELHTVWSAYCWRMLAHFWHPPYKNDKLLIDWAKELLTESMARLDYALVQRPRFIDIWEQREWITPFARVVSKLQERAKHQKQNAVSDSEENNELKPILIGLRQPDYVKYLQYWMAWRIANYIQHDDFPGGDSTELSHAILKQAKEFALSPKGSWFYFPLALSKHTNSVLELDMPEKDLNNKLTLPFRDAYQMLRSERTEFAHLLKKTDESQLVGNFGHTKERILIAEKLWEHWQLLCSCFEGKFKEDGYLFQADNPTTKIQEPTFGERVAIDIYSELSVFLLRLLATNQQYSRAAYVAKVTGGHLRRWVNDRWELYSWSFLHEENGKIEEVKRKNLFKFSPYVFRYHRATILAWHAYIQIRLKNEFSSHWSIQKGSSPNFDDGSWLDQIEQSVEQALKLHPRHPLGIFVQAQIFTHRQLYSRAIDELHHLLNVIAPFDPKTHTANWELVQTSRQAKEQRSDAQTDITRDLRTELYYMERVTGQRQFEDVLGRPHIHTSLAELYAKLGNVELSIEHSQQAIGWAPYEDLDMNNFLALAERLSERERFREALDAVQEAKERANNVATHPEASIYQFSSMKRVSAYILECVINSRLKNYPTALQAGETIYRKTFVGSLQSPKHQGTVNTWKTLVEFFQELKSSRQGNKSTSIMPINFFDTVIEICRQSSAETNREVIPILQELDNFRIWIMSLGREETHRKENSTIISVESEQNAEARNGSQDSRLDNFTVDESIEKLIRHFFFTEAVMFIEQQCELSNNMAYNRTELNIELTWAEADARRTVQVMEGLLERMMDVHPNYSHNRRRLAQYYDTLGWTYYRLAGTTEKNRQIKGGSTSRLLNNAEQAFRKALTYDQGSAIIHYHIARLRITQIETRWQQFTRDEKQNVPPNAAAQIRRYLRSAARHCFLAQRLDAGKRLYADLLTCRQRIIKYGNNWGKIQLQGVDID